jgi:hypothetical protein
VAGGGTGAAVGGAGAARGGAGAAVGGAGAARGGAGAGVDSGENNDSSRWKAPVSPDETDGAGARNSAGGACRGAELHGEGGAGGACRGAVLHGEGGGSAGACGAALHEVGGSAGPHGEDAAPGLRIGGNSDSGGPEDGLAGGDGSSGGLKVVNGLRTRMRRPHESQN